MRWPRWSTQRARAAADDDAAGLANLAFLARGGFGAVYSATLNGDPVAAKYIDRARMRTSDAQLLETECDVWACLRHDCLMPLLALRRTARHVVMVTELMDHSLADRHEHMRAIGSRPRIRTVADGLVQVAAGMAHLHGHAPPIVHRDLKSQNVLVRGATWKVADFGLARYVTGDRMTAETGSYRWMAPEVIRHEPYDTRADVYSFGMLLYECLALSVPFVAFSPFEAALAVARDGKRPTLPHACDASVTALAEACWHQDPARRPPFERVQEALSRLRVHTDSPGSSPPMKRREAPANPGSATVACPPPPSNPLPS